MTNETDKPKNFIKESNPCVLVEGPRWADTNFYGKWLLAVAEADVLWKEAIKEPGFESRVSRLSVVYLPDLSITATVLLSRLEKNLASLVVDLNEEEGMAEFAMMITIGFFALTGERYQMVIPAQLNMEMVKDAALKLALTGDEECYLHPEYFIVTMAYARAQEWQARLLHMDENQRCADRALLLSGISQTT